MLNKFLLVGLSITIATVVLSLAAPLLTPYDPTKTAGERFTPPSPSHPLGTDHLGRDVFARVAYGGRIVLAITSLAVMISLAAGVFLGLFSGLIGGKIDRIATMVMDSMYAFPSLILAIAISAVLGPTPINAAVAIGVVYIPTYFRIVRGQVLSIKTSPFVEAAVLLGASRTRIVIKHILPHLWQSVLVVATLNATDALLTESALSFLGFTITPPTPDWGFDLNAYRPYLLSGYTWLLAPGVLIFVLAFALSLLGEGLNDWISARRARV